MTSKELQNLLKKALVYNLMVNLDTTLNDKDIKHSHLSSRTGRQGNWFNDAKNNNEDIRVSTLARIFAAIQPRQETGIDTETTEMLKDVFSKRVFDVSERLNNVADGEGTPIRDLIQSDRDFYQDRIGDWAAVRSLGKLTEQEVVQVNQIRDWLK